MQDSAEKQTADLVQSAKRGRGRPVTGKAQSSADRQRAYRERLKNGLVPKKSNVTENKENIVVDVEWFVERIDQLQQQVSDLFNREAKALSEVARLQRLLDLTGIDLIEERNRSGELLQRVYKAEYELDRFRQVRKRNVTKKEQGA